MKMTRDQAFWNKAEGNWKQFTGAVKENWGELTDDQIAKIDGKKDKLIGLIQETYGVSQEKAISQVEKWSIQE